jgi:hypothetical protein
MKNKKYHTIGTIQKYHTVILSVPDEGYFERT